MSTETNFKKLKKLYSTVKLIEIPEILYMRGKYPDILYEMGDLLKNEFKRVMPPEQSKDFLIMHNMNSTISHIRYAKDETKLRRALAQYDCYLHLIHEYLETRTFKVLSSCHRRDDDTFDIWNWEWDNVYKRWEPTLDTLDKAIEMYRDKAMEWYQSEHGENLVTKGMNEIITRYEARKKRLIEKW